MLSGYYFIQMGKLRWFMLVITVNSLHIHIDFNILFHGNPEPSSGLLIYTHPNYINIQTEKYLSRQ